MVAKLLLVVGIIALVFVACQALVPGDEGLVVVFQPTPPEDPTEAAQYYAQRTQAAAESQETKDARQAAKAQGALDTQATLDERARRAAADERAAEAEALAYRVQLTQAAGEATAHADNARRKETRQARETQTERDWIVQGWTATADSAQATSTAAVALAAVQRQETADAAGVQALQTAQANQAFVTNQRATQEALRTTRLALTNTAQAWLPYVGWLLLAIVLPLSLWYFRRHQVIRRDPNGAAPLVRVGDRVMDPDRSALPVLDPRVPAQVPLDAHLQITGNAQKVQAVQAGLFTKTSPEKGLKLMQPKPAAPASTPAAMPTRPADWSIFTRAAGPIPLGAGLDGQLVQPDPDEWAHMLYAGMTGAGKSRYGIRPYIAGALARGWNVVSLGDHAPVDLKVFEQHHNFHALTLDDPAQVLPYIEAINLEVKARWQVLYDAGASTWSRLNRAAPRVAVVFDEFAELIDSLNGDVKREFIARVTNVSRLARKAGVHLVLGIQNPTRDNVRMSIRRNMLPIAFHVNDRVGSQVILDADGAEKLARHQFLARFQEVCPGLGFDPSDDQIASYLAARPAPFYDPPSFLVKLPSGQGDTEPVLLSAPAADPEIERLAELVRPAWERGESKRAMARFVGKEYAGWFAGQIDKAVAYLAATTTPSNPGNTAPNLPLRSSSSAQ